MGAGSSINKLENDLQNDSMSNNSIDSSMKPKVTFNVVSKDRHNKLNSMDNIQSILANESESGNIVFVVISKSGFSKSHINLCLGQIITFVWDEGDSSGFNVTQVVHDGEFYRPVIGGIFSGPLTKKGHFEYKFNMIGDYKFVSAGLKSSPLNVTICKAPIVTGIVNNEGFNPNNLLVNEGQEVTWKWTECDPPIFVCQVQKCKEHLGIKILEKSLPNLSNSGQFDFIFKDPGLYYFASSSNFTNFKMCLVEVKETCKDYIINVTDTAFDPSILIMEEGDRVWWSWDKNNCTNPHCIYQVESPKKSSNLEESYKPVKEGFRWPKPTKCGLLSHIFDQCGVYHFSDHNYQETAAYAGTIIVKSRPIDHHVEIKKNGFEKELLFVKTGDRVWWIWESNNFSSTFNLVLETFTLTPAIKNLTNISCKDDCKLLDRQSLEMCNKFGVDHYAPLYAGVYHFRSSNEDNFSTTFTLIVSFGIRNYTIYVKDNGFDPQLLTVHPFDRIWWIWKTPNLSLNVEQVKSNGELMEGGFTSGGYMESPSAFMHSFEKPGVFYCSSQKFLGKQLGIIIVKLQPLIHEIAIFPESVHLNPILVNVNDVVIWTFQKFQIFSIVNVKSIESLRESYEQSVKQNPRRCLEKGFDNIGMFHFTSKSFRLLNGVEQKAASDPIFSTLIVDSFTECTMIKVTSDGFFPSECAILKSENVLWTWRNNSNEEHNIIYVNPNDKKNDNNAQLSNTLNSGKPEKNSSFFYTFDLPGLYYVASVGAPGYTCAIFVLNQAQKTPPPIFNYGEIGDQKGDQLISVARNHRIFINCGPFEKPLKELKIYYTLDGMTPFPHNDTVKFYNFQSGIKLDKSGLYVIRALSIARDMLYSDLTMSRQIVVVKTSNSNETENTEKDISETAHLDREISERTGENWLWYNCIPSISVNNFYMGNMMIDINHNSEKSCEVIQAYRIFINGTNYYGDINPSCQTLNLSGFLSTKQYDICLTAECKSHLQFGRHVSNHLNIKVPATNEMGGPFLSCYTSDVETNISLIWKNISLSSGSLIKSYQIVIDDQPSESFIKPQKSSTWCRISFEDCAINKEYKFQLICIPENENIENVKSNELIIKLPLYRFMPTVHSELVELDIENQHLPLEINSLTSEFIFIQEIDQGDSSNFNAFETVSESLNKTEENHSSYLTNSLYYGEKGKEEDSLSDTTYGNVELKSEITYDTENSKDAYDNDMDIDSNISLISSKKERFRSAKSKSHNTDKSQNSNKSSLLKKKKISKLIKFGSRNKIASIVDKEVGEGNSTNSVSEESLQISEHSNIMRHNKNSVNHEMIKNSIDPNSFPVDERNEKVFDYLSHLENLPKEVTNTNKLTEMNNFKAIPSPTQFDIDIDATGKSWVNKFKLLSATQSAFIDLQKRANKKPAHQLARLSISSKSEFEIEVKDDSKSDVSQLTTGIHKEASAAVSKVVMQPTISLSNFAYSKFENQDTDFNDEQGLNNQPAISIKNNMPIPLIEVKQISISEILVKWSLDSEIPKHLKIPVYNLQISGLQFKNIVNSDLSYFEKDLVTHVWNIANENKCFVSGLLPRINYTIHVSATFIMASKQNKQQLNELSTYSEKINYRLAGPPKAPILSVKSIDIYQVILQWEVEEYDFSELKAFYIQFHNQSKEIKVPVEEKNIVIDNIVDGQFLEIFIFSENIYGKSDKSNSISIKTSPKPVAPVVISEPTFNHGESIISWTHDSSMLPQNFKIIFFRIFMDDVWHTDITADSAALSNNEKYNFVFQNLEYDISHEIKVVSVAGSILNEENVVYCYSHSNLSSPIIISGFKPPDAALLHIESMNSKGILLNWDSPEETDNYHVIGYRILKNGFVYGSNVIPNSVNSLWIKDIMLGNRVELQLITLTNINDNNNAPSSKIVIHYTGLVSSPTKFEVESVNGFGAVLAWNKVTEKKHHFIPPDHFQVTWWNSTNPDNFDVRSISTKDSMVYITDLTPNTNYTAVLEGRSVNNFKEIYEEKSRSCFNHKITLSSDPIKLNFKTSAPPTPPKNLCVVSATGSSIALQWDSPIEYGSEIVFLVMYYSESSEKSLKQCKTVELTPDAKNVIINHLSENVEYNFRLFAVTQEYFLSLPNNFKKESASKLELNEDGSIIGDKLWVVSVNILAYTAGTFPPKNICVQETFLNKIKIEWSLPSANGTNRLLSQVIRISEKTHSNKDDSQEQSSICINVDKYCHVAELDRLLPATMYRIDVEAVVSIKTILNIDKFRDNFDNDDDNRRTTHYPCKVPLFARTKTSPSPPQFLTCSKIVTNTIYISWQQPLMYTTVVHDGNNQSTDFIRHRLEAYRVYVNNKLHATLKPNILSVKLTKCKFGRNSVKISSLINPDYIPKAEIASLFSNLDESMPKALGLDESCSDELLVTINQPVQGAIKNLTSNIINNKDKYDIDLNWDIYEFTNENFLKQFGVSCFHENSIIKQVLDRNARMTKFTNLLSGFYYTLQVDSLFVSSSHESIGQKIQIFIPGLPKAPLLTCRKLDDENLTVEWTDINVGNDWKIKSFQIFINDSSIAKELENTERTAQITLKNNNHYKVSLCVRLQIHKEQIVTEFSNPIYVSTGPKRRLISQMEYDKFNNMRVLTVTESEMSGNCICLNATQNTDTTVALSWTIPQSLNEDIYSYQVIWKCIQGFEEQKISIPNSKTFNYEVENLMPGLKYAFRLLAFDNGKQVIEKSKQLYLETNTVLEAPNLQLKATNFSYATICWNSTIPKGNVKLKCFHIYVNGVMSIEVEASNHIYTYYDGQPCHQYSFLCQAISYEEKYNSKPSNTVKCIWPGCISPPLTSLTPMVANSIRVSWGNPTLSDGAKIKHFRVICSNSETGELIQAVNFIHPESRESEIFHVKFNQYVVRLETYLHGAPYPYLSEPLLIQPETGPDPPVIQLQLLNINDRIELLNKLRNCINEEDSIMRCIHYWGSQNRHTEEEKSLFFKASSLLPAIQENIDNYVYQMSRNDDYVIAELKWTQKQTENKVNVTGFKVLVDGKYYGRELDATCKSVLIKLNVDSKTHKIAMTSVSNKPRLLSGLSNVIEVLTNLYPCLRFFCKPDIHQKSFEVSKCPITLTLTSERNNLSHNYNPEFCVKVTTCPILNLHGSDSKESSFPTPTANIKCVIFWMPNCENSIHFLNNFLTFASEEVNKNFTFATIACINFPTEAPSGAFSVNNFLQNLHQQDNIAHYYCFDHEMNLKETHGKFHNAFKILDIQSIPLIILINNENKIVYRGRYCADEYSDIKYYLSLIIHKAFLKYIYDPFDDWRKTRGFESSNRDINMLKYENQGVQNSTKKNTENNKAYAIPAHESVLASNLQSEKRINSMKLKPKFSTTQIE